MVHVPTLSSVTIEFDTLQTDAVLELNTTGNCELALADTTTGTGLTLMLGSAAKVIA